MDGLSFVTLLTICSCRFNTEDQGSLDVARCQFQDASPDRKIRGVERSEEEEQGYQQVLSHSYRLHDFYARELLYKFVTWCTNCVTWCTSFVCAKLCVCTDAYICTKLSLCLCPCMCFGLKPCRSWFVLCRTRKDIFVRPLNSPSHDVIFPLARSGEEVKIKPGWAVETAKRWPP